MPKAVGLPARVRPEHGVREHEQRAGVRRHRARDVEEEHEPASAAAALAEVALDRLATGSKRAPDRAAKIGRARPRALAPAGAAGRHGELDPRHELGQCRQLLLRAAGEALLLQDLDLARQQQLRFRLLLAAVLAVLALRLAGLELHRLALFLLRDDGQLAEEGAEDPVVDGDVVPPRHERAAAGPVQISRRQERGRAAEVVDTARAHGHPLAAESAPELDKALFAPREGLGFSHVRGRGGSSRRGAGRRGSSAPSRACRPRRPRSPTRRRGSREPAPSRSPRPRPAA